MCRMRVACWISKATFAQLHARARAHTHTRSACTHPRARTRAIRICNTYCFSTATMIRERASLLCYTYISCLVLFCSDNLCILLCNLQDAQKLAALVDLSFRTGCHN